MAVNRGKQFEGVIHDCFEKVPDTSITRLHDQTMGYLGARNPCDFIIYHKPYLYAVECKSVHGNTLSIYSKDPKRQYGAITNYQWQALLEMSTVRGVHAGILVWFIDHDETLWFDINLLQRWRDAGHKSIHSYPEWVEYVKGKHDWCYLTGRKKRVFYEYDMQLFFLEMEDKL